MILLQRTTVAEAYSVRLIMHLKSFFVARAMDSVKKVHFQCGIWEKSPLVFCPGIGQSNRYFFRFNGFC